MGQPTWIQEHIVWPIQTVITKWRLKVLTKTLNSFCMDWGKYPIEEIIKMYSKHENEINRN